jgi:peroxiredoxin
LAAIRDAYDRLTGYGVEVAAVSVDTPEQLAKLRGRLDLPFVLLSDRERAVVTEWGLLNRRERGGIAFPATWVIDRELFVRYRALERKARRVDLEPVLRFLGGEIPSDDAVRVRRVLPDLGASLRYPADLVGYLVRGRRS